MAVVKNLMTRAGFDASGMRKGVRQAQSELVNFKKSVSGTMRKIGAALAVTGIGFGIRSATKEAMNFESSLQQIDRMMGANASTFNKWAKENASAFGMARSEATKYGSVFANLISGFASGTAQTAEYTQDLLKASAVIASSTGRTIEDTMDRIRSGMLGSTEAIEDLGINVNVAMIEATDAFKRFANGKSWQQLDFQTQQTVRYFAILEQAASKYGTEIAQNTNSDQAKFIAQLKNAQLSLGQAFLPIYNAVLPALTRFATALANVMSYVAAFSQALFGSKKAQEQTKAVTGQASAVGDLADAYTDAGNAAKGSVAGFDEVNSLGDASGGASGIAGALPATGTGADQEGVLSGVSEAMDSVAAKAKEMADKVKSAVRGITDAVVEHKDLIIAGLAGITAGFTTALIATNWAAIITGISKAWQALAVSVRVAWVAMTGPIGLVVAAVALAVAAFVYFYRTNETFKGIVDGILKAIGDTALWLWNSVLRPLGMFLVGFFKQAIEAVSIAGTWLWLNVMVPLGSWLASTFIAILNAVSAAATWLWLNVMVPLGNFFLWFWNSVLLPIGAVLVDVLAFAFGVVSTIAYDFWQLVLVPLANFFSTVFGPTVEAVSAVFGLLWNKVLVPFGQFLSSTFRAVLQDIISVFEWLWDSVLKPLGRFIADKFQTTFENLTVVIEFLWYSVLKPLGTFLSGIFIGIFRNTFETIGNLIDNAATAFKGLMNFITGVFTGDWEKAWNGVKDIFAGVFGSLWSIVKHPLNMIVDGINAVISGLNSISFSLPDWIPGIGGKSFGISIPSIPRLAKGGITNGPTLAMIGDNPGGEEVVSPLDDLVDIVQSAVSTAVMAAAQMFGGNNGGQKGDVVIQIGGTEVARILNPFVEKENKRLGSSLITTT